MHIGIGIDKNAERVTGSLTSASKSNRITIFSKTNIPGTPYDIVVSDNAEEELIKALYEGRIDAAVRGTLPANAVMKLLKGYGNVKSLKRIALLETQSGTKFLLAPVGVDEGWTREEKVEFVGYAREIASALGMNEKTAILSGGRLGDIGRHPVVDKTIEDAEAVAAETSSDHMEILIEDAVRDHGIIIAPDGISGNLVFRTLALLGGGRAHGAPVANLDRIFVDTSRASSDYSNAVFLASALADYKQKIF
ncbi:methanogenesis marker protein Mmp4/MtxX [Methanolacinia paynteri]|uniref:methanogenesis marker protein Mmp4/MtxX n=1 Tax=Methanolacinia paynteri TaxID=230356 RepID=UPI00064E36C3|nr:methanogenesis marker protein Mmp4/MtxX [Methanolacinia paynteri]